MERTMKNLARILKAKAENCCGLAEMYDNMDAEYDSPEYETAARSYKRDARILEAVVSMIEDEKSFEWYANNYDVKEEA